MAAAKASPPASMRDVRATVRARRALLRAALPLIGAAAVGASAQAEDASGAARGVVLAIDLETFSLRPVDLDAQAAGPELRVALGSPAHPTPAGAFPIRRVVRNPGWVPGFHARAAGARRHAPSSDGPLGVAKIPFDYEAIAIHGGTHRYALGHPVTLGCVGAADASLLDLLGWLEERGALGPARHRPSGEIHQEAARPILVVLGAGVDAPLATSEAETPEATDETELVGLDLASSEVDAAR